MGDRIITMHKLPENTDSQRKCFRCGEVFPTTKQFFYADKHRPLGLSYECKSCLSIRKIGRDRRTERWANLSPERKAKVKVRQQKYNRTNKGRAIFLRKAYQRIDSCDLTTGEVLQIIEMPCHYCGTTEHNRGLDRIDNSLGHNRGNVLSCCRDCNSARGDRLTVDEMLMLGAVIRSIRDRRANPTHSAGNPGRFSTNRPT